MPFSNLPDFDYIEIEKMITSKKNKKEQYGMVVNAPFKFNLAVTMLDLGVIVLLIKKAKTINRIALSETDSARGARMASVVPFEKIQIPIDASGNSIARAIALNEPQSTEDWATLFTPVLAAKQARNNQKAAGIDCSYVFPWENGKLEGALIYSYYQPKQTISKNHHAFMKTYTALVAKTM